MFNYPEPIPPYHNWIEELRLKRIEEGEAKYGPLTPWNFRVTGRDPVAERIMEDIDAITYWRMAYQMDRIPRKIWQNHTEELKRMLREAYLFLKTPL